MLQGALIRTGQKYEWLVHFFYFVARPIFPPKICRPSNFVQTFLAYIDRKWLQKRLFKYIEYNRCRPFWPKKELSSSLAVVQIYTPPVAFSLVQNPDIHMFQSFNFDEKKIWVLQKKHIGCPKNSALSKNSGCPKKNQVCLTKSGLSSFAEKEAILKYVTWLQSNAF